MAKPALGKGLGQLMAGQPAAQKPPPSGPPRYGVSTKVTPVDFGRGMNTLVAGSPAEKPEVQKKKQLLPVWFFCAADVLLLAFTVAICADAAGPMEFGELAFAFIATALACFLGIISVLRAAERL